MTLTLWFGGNANIIEYISLSTFPSIDCGQDCRTLHKEHFELENGGREIPNKVTRVLQVPKEEVLLHEDRRGRHQLPRARQDRQ